MTKQQLVDNIIKELNELEFIEDLERYTDEATADLKNGIMKHINALLTQELIDSLNTVIEYSYKDEYKDYMSEPEDQRKGHIYESIEYLHLFTRDLIKK